MVDADGECEACNRLARWIVHVQWTLFDFLDINVCGVHVNECLAAYRHALVDDQEPVELWTSRITHHKSGVGRKRRTT